MPVIYSHPKRKEPQGKKKKRVAKRLVKRRSEEPRTVNPLAAFVARPADIRFETQEKEEEIILLLRRHWLTNVPWILAAVLMVLAPLVLRFFPLIEFLPPRYQFISVVIWYLLTLAFVFEKFLSWFFNVNIVTDERIVDIDFHSLLYREISDCKIDRIQDVTYNMGGVIRTLFNYGDVLIQTAGERPVFEFGAVPKPALVMRKINELIAEEEQEKIDGRVR